MMTNIDRGKIKKVNKPDQDGHKYNEQLDSLHCVTSLNKKTLKKNSPCCSTITHIFSHAIIHALKCAISCPLFRRDTARQYDNKYVDRQVFKCRQVKVVHCLY